MSRKDMNLSFFKAFQVMFSYKIKSGELINDLEKKMDYLSDSLVDSIVKKNKEINSNIEDFILDMKRNISLSSFTLGTLIGATGFFFINNLNMFKNINIKF